MTRQSKRASFYAAQRRARLVARIHRTHSKAKGYLGATLALTVTLKDGTVVRAGPGAIFIGER